MPISSPQPLDPPFSRTFPHTAWPIRAFSLLSKPGGPACNLACSYCYYSHKSDLLDLPGHHPLSDDLLERFIRDYIASQDNYTVFFSWQGGEPTLMGLDFYRRVMALEKKHARPGLVIVNDLQTNGLLLDDTWCAFLQEHGWLVGLSIDGPQHIHDQHRRTRSGSPTYERVRAALRCLQKYGCGYTTLTTITPANVTRVEELYDFLTQELGSTTLQFQPCVERKDFHTVAPHRWDPATMPLVGSSAARPGTPDSLLTDWSISAEQWGEFLCRLFDRWWAKDRQRVVVNWFDSWASQWVGGPALMCICSPTCGRALAMERDGRVYSCDHYVYDDYCLGTLGPQSLDQMIRSTRQRTFGEAKHKALPTFCQNCPFLFACYGECPKRRFLRLPNGETGLNYLCAGYRRFFDHAGARLTEHGQRMMGTRPPK